MVDEETLKARQVQLQRSPPLPVESTTATLTAAPEAPAAVTARAARRGARARCCARGHMIARKGEAFGLFQDKKICHACCTTFGPETSYYRCMQNCKYNVCHHCFQEARHSEAQQMLEGQSEPSCQESHSDVESVLEFEVHGGLRSELWPFAESRSRPFAAQLEELAEVFEVPHGVLLHSQGSEVEVIQSILQLQALPRTASLALEAPQQLLQQLLGQMSSSPDALRHIGRMCATEALAAEAFRQGALPALVAQLCCSTERATSTASATGLCALLRPTRKEEAKEQLEQLWSEHGDALLRRLTRPGVGKAETALLLWLVEELELASETFRALQEGDSGSPSAAEEGEREGPSSGLQEQEMGRDVLELLRESCAVPCSEAQQLQRGKQLKEAKLFAERLQRTVRRQHRALKAMVPLVKLQDVELEKTLQKIVEDGWDSTDWPDGQNLLHFLCQHGDAQTVRLAAELCPDLEARDGQDLRAMDYALSNSDASVAEELLLVSQERRSFRFLEETTVDELAKVPRSMSLVSQEVLAPGPRESGHAVPTVPDQSEAQHWAQCTAPGSNEVQCTGLEVQGDGHGIGALYMLRTQLAKERKEKEMWREKAQEVEQLRTRLAIWTEKPDAPPDRLAAVTLSAAEGSAATPRERGAVSGDFRRSEAPEERGESQRAETKLQLSPWQAPDPAASPAARAPPRRLSWTQPVSPATATPLHGRQQRSPRQKGSRLPMLMFQQARPLQETEENLRRQSQWCHQRARGKAKVKPFLQLQAWCQVRATARERPKARGRSHRPSPRSQRSSHIRS
ncbi:unnamed protein product [Durusdinium trenchii]|uniref:Uncharacterized protein n=1 Tax=Durusdinium trenchii TaxID=1381693 RepID=A0ABP0NWU9_9DINO